MSSQAPSARFAPGTRGFLLVLAAAMGMTALAIDAMLPAFGEIRAEFGYSENSSAVTGLVTAFMAGLGIGQLPAGLLADRFGRRPVLWGGIAIYVVGALLAMLAPSLPLMIAARFLWGLGAAGPRVAVFAMVRDSYQGEQMARQMSTIMAVFLIVPMIAPSVGAGLLAIGPWRLVFGFMILIGLLVLALSTGLPATMPAGKRRRLTLKEVLASWRIVLSTPGTLGYLLSMTAIMSVFLAYVGSSEAIVVDIYDRESWFPVIFGAVSLVLAIAVLANGRSVERLGLRFILRFGPVVLVAVALLFALVVWMGDGKPPLGLFLVSLTLVLVMMQVLQTNINSAAMLPLGSVAGSGSALLGMIPMVLGSVIASFINGAVDHTVTPFAWAFVIGSVAALIGSRWALQVAPLDAVRRRPATR